MKADQLLCAYEQAVHLKIYEGSLVWSRTQSMLVVNTILLTAVGIFLSSSSKGTNDLVLGILSVFGFLLSFIWLITSIRGFAFNRFWSYCIRELEEGADGLNLLTKGDRFRKNLPVEFNFVDKESELKGRYQRPRIARVFNFINTENGTYIIIVLFILIYIGLFVLALTHNTNFIKVG